MEVNIPIMKNRYITSAFPKTGFVILYLYLTCLPFSLIGQSQNTNSKISSLLDSIQNIYGSSDLLVNGSVYYQPNRQALGTPFLYSPEIEQGSVYTRGIAFNGVGINYNITSQKLLLLNTMPDGSRLLIDLSDILIDSFLIRDYLFIAPAKLHITSNYAYMMAINLGRYRMFIGYKKEFINRYNQRNPYGKYSSTKQALFLVSDSISLRINSKKTFLNTFPPARKEISTYLRQHKIKLLRATPEQLKQLMEFYNHQRYLDNE